MLNAPATGEAMAELILDGTARHVDLAPFAPRSPADVRSGAAAWSLDCSLKGQQTASASTAGISSRVSARYGAQKL
jgi:hypothetical protein